jgi:Tol biopolymer transport system component
VATVAGANGRIAFARFDPALGDDVTYTMNADGSDLRPLFPGFTSGAPHWAPDGTDVAVNSGLGNICPPTCSGHTVIIDPTTGHYRVITPDGYPTVAIYCSIWSPDATHFICEGGNDTDASVNGLYIVRTSDGGGVIRLTDARGMRDLPIDYSPDGRQVVFSRFEGDNCDGKAALYVINTDGTGLRRITPWGFCDDDGSWSPDGGTIAFVRNDGFIFTVHPDGSGLTKLSLATSGRSYAGDVAWSPDGRRIVMLLTVRTGTHEYQEGIATANGDGTDVRLITLSPTFDHSPSWGAIAAAP